MNTKEIIVKGKKWCLRDKVLVKLNNQIGYISGFTAGGFNIFDISNNQITVLGHKSKYVNAKQVELVCRNNNWLVQSVLGGS